MVQFSFKFLIFKIFSNSNMLYSHDPHKIKILLWTDGHHVNNKVLSKGKMRCKREEKNTQIVSNPPIADPIINNKS